MNSPAPPTRRSFLRMLPAATAAGLATLLGACAGPTRVGVAHSSRHGTRVGVSTGHRRIYHHHTLGHRPPPRRSSSNRVSVGASTSSRSRTSRRVR